MVIGLMRRAFGGSGKHLISDTDEFSFSGMNEGIVVQEWYGIVVGPSHALSFGGAILSHDCTTLIVDYLNVDCTNRT